jgi:ABC-type Zn uptake system ZnuABC Zn-binding protein ZnuA
MKKSGFLLTLICLAAVTFSNGCTQNSTPKLNDSKPEAEASSPRLKVVTSTTQLSTILESVGGEHVTVTSIIPPKENPLDYEIRPEDIQKLSDADIFVLYDWQIEKFNRQVLDSASNSHLVLVKLTIINSWLVPAGQTEIVDKIAGALSQIDRKNETSYYNAAKKYKTSVDDKEYSVLSNLVRKLPSTITSPNVICAKEMEDFIKWMGLTVVATYDGHRPITPDVLRELIEKGKAQKVATVADDLQSGQDNLVLAREIGARRFLFSSYPGGFDYAWSWAETIDANISLLLRASLEC